MKKFSSFLFIVLLFSCRKSSTSSNLNQWSQVSTYNGDAFTDPIGFAIGNQLYVGMGCSFASGLRTTECVAYDISSNVWSQVTAYPDPTRIGPGISFTINGTGYTLLAHDTLIGQLWAYNTEQKGWIRLADYPGRFSTPVTGFSVNGKAYVGLSDSTDSSRFYEYDPVKNAWSTISDFPGGRTYGATSFVIGNYAYVGLGTDLLVSPDSAFFAQFYRYDPTANSWSSVAVFPGTHRGGAAGFSVGGKGYVVGGIDIHSNFLKDVWQYDPSTNAWTREPDFPGAARENALSFPDSTDCYFGFGNGVNPAYTDLWKFKP